jgi:hypothetical protein
MSLVMETCHGCARFRLRGRTSDEIRPERAPRAQEPLFVCRRQPWFRAPLPAATNRTPPSLTHTPRPLVGSSRISAFALLPVLQVGKTFGGNPDVDASKKIGGPQVADWISELSD